MLNTILLQATAAPVSGSTLMWVLFIALTLISMLVSKNVERKFKKYKSIRTEGGLTGREVAEMMLRDHDISNVQVCMVKGTLTDHYNPANRTLNLSPDVYNGTSVAAAAVAAHECGHAVQHKEGYAPLKLRSALVPAVNISSKLSMIVIIIGLLIINTFHALFWVGIAMFAMVFLFSVVTLPVEFNASKRALVWLKSSNSLGEKEAAQAKEALGWAASTYVVAALSSLVTLLYYIGLGDRR